MEHDSGPWWSGLQEYFDEDHSGTLEKGEVIRALIKTFRLSSDLSKVRPLLLVTPHSAQPA